MTRTSKPIQNTPKDAFVGILVVANGVFIFLPLVYLGVLVASGWAGNRAVGLGALYLQPIFWVGAVVAVVNMVCFGYYSNFASGQLRCLNPKGVISLSAAFEMFVLAVTLIVPDGLHRIVYSLYTNDNAQEAYPVGDEKDSLIDEVSAKRAKEITIDTAQNLL